jgi:uncharacterized protein (DUF58 family)
MPIPIPSVASVVGTSPLPPGRIHLRPTAASVFLLIVLVAVVLGAINYQSNAAYLVLAVLVAAALLSLLHARQALAAVTVRPLAARPVFAGEPLAAPVWLRTGSAPIYALVLTVPDVEALKPQELAPLTGERREQVLLPGRPRGLHAVGRVRLSTTWPLGLARAWRDMPADWTWIVYPRPLPVDDASICEPGDGEGDGLALTGGGDFRGHRGWRSGESQRRIDWKAAARGRPLLVKDFAGASAEQVFAYASLDGDRERRLSLLAGLVLAAERTGRRYGLALGDGEIAPGLGDAHCHACLTALALFPGDVR